MTRSAKLRATPRDAAVSINAPRITEAKMIYAVAFLFGLVASLAFLTILGEL